MDRAIRRWSAILDTPIYAEELAHMIKKWSKTYMIYGSMLLLPADTINGADFQGILYSRDGNNEVSLYEQIAKELKITHIAINHPIPMQRDAATQQSENIIRSPLHFQPIYGDFGPADASLPATRQDFEQAYWVTAKQNGIAQTWAPRWTMFSRGNISEKARLLTLYSVQTAVKEGQDNGRGCSMVDLYAGIGYFTFSYIKAGVDKALCWELNEWSCEGLRMGAKSNRWQSITYDESKPAREVVEGDERIVIFNETNELALSRLKSLRSHIPPVRHVNCGLLPTSKSSWLIALDVLDPEQGGWIHVHENFGSAEIEQRATASVDVFQSYLQSQSDTRRAVLENIIRVKTYAPGVFHCVLDIYILPAEPASSRIV